MSTDLANQDPELLRRLLRAKDRMDAASHEEWPVRRLARVSGVSEAHFARSFKEAFGVPPHRYLLTRRIERAKALLRDTDLSITEIAFQTGWRAWARSAAPSATSPARARASSGRARGPRRTSSAACPSAIVSAAHRPDLTIAVSEKRRQEAGGINEPEETGGPMSQGVEVVGLYVRDQDEALEFYVEKLGFRVHTDVKNGDYRWLTVQHPDQPSFQLGLFTPGPPVLDAATAQALREIVAKGAMPPLVLVVDDCRAAYERMRARGRGVHAGARGPLRHRGRRLPRSVGQRLEDDPGAPLRGRRGKGSSDAMQGRPPEEASAAPLCRRGRSCQSPSAPPRGHYALACCATSGTGPT